MNDILIARPSTERPPNAVAAPTAGMRGLGVLRRLHVSSDRLAHNRPLAIVVVGLLAALSCATVALVVQLPQPRVHDEFGYLLAADTFAHGRLTNPTLPPPVATHFETFHTLLQPTYMTKFPPAQGLVLAAGQVFGGHPIVGVWFGISGMCVAICWMLFAWLPPRWALLGGFLTVIQYGVVGYWAQSYWGGQVAATGGALLFGALPRLKRGVRVRDVVLLAFGLGILANTRPFEGFTISAVALTALIVWMLGPGGPPRAAWVRRIILPAALVLGPVVAGMGYYNFRVTGSPLMMPYRLFEVKYGLTPVPFVFQRPWPSPVYPYKPLRDYNEGRLWRMYLAQQSIGGLIRSFPTKLANTWRFFIGPALTLPLVMLPWVVRDRRVRLLTITCGVFMLVQLFVVVMQAHYTAPATALIVALVVQSLRHLRVWRWRGQPVGRALVWLSVLLCVAQLVPRIMRDPRKASDWSMRRARLLAQLERDDDRHLVVVRYGPRHHPYHEWVFNGADLEHAKVLWARDLGAEQNRALIDYFKDRKIWLLEADPTQPVAKMSPYSSATVGTQ